MKSFICFSLTLLALTLPANADPLPSWNDGTNKQAIISFVERTTTADSPDYVEPAKRIATFDNDGCLWSEQPIYFQLIFIIDQIKKLAPQHPEWKTSEPFASILKGDRPSSDLCRRQFRRRLPDARIHHRG